MSETHGGNGSVPPSIAEAFYGREGPINGGPSDPKTRAVIDSGIAKPADDQPRPASPRSQSSPPGPPAPQTRPTGPSPTTSSSPFDPARFTAPDGATFDQAALTEFGTTAKELGISHQAGEKLLALHSRAVAQETAAREEMWNGWHRETQRAFGDRLPDVVADIKDAVGSDADAQEFYRLLAWSGAEHSPQVLRVLHRLATGRR